MPKIRNRIDSHSRLRIEASVLAALATLCAIPPGFGHGCVSAGSGGFCPLSLSFAVTPESGYLQPDDWRVTGSYRWFRSDRHFIGDEEFTLPNDRGHETINEAHYFEINLQRSLSQRLTMALTVPIVHYTRSTFHEHDFTGRYETSASGPGDMRLTAYYWLSDPAKSPNGNVALGFGPKFPTGEYDAEDSFHTANGVVRKPVDQSIQPGDGGWGFTVEVDAFRRLSDKVNAYLQGYYLSNPQNTNGVSTLVGSRNPYEDVNSIPDQYLGRLGLSYSAYPKWGLSLSHTITHKSGKLGRSRAYGLRPEVRPGTSSTLDQALAVAWSVGCQRCG